MPRSARASVVRASAVEPKGVAAKTGPVPGRSFLKSKPIGVGSAAPAGVIKNADLESVVETSDEWIKSRTGISQRRILASGGHIKGA